MFGPLLAPSKFVFGMPRENSGKASKEDIASALRMFISYLKRNGAPSPFVVLADDAIEVLLYLELCYPVEGKLECIRLQLFLTMRFLPTFGVKIARWTCIVGNDTSVPAPTTSSRRLRS